MIIGRYILFIIGAWLLYLGIGFYKDPVAEGEEIMGVIIGLPGLVLVLSAVFVKGTPSS